MIEVQDLVKRFGGFTALDGASITVPDGAVYGLVGPNGAGKSTLIRHITGVYRGDRGQVLVDGEPIYENPERKALVAAIPDEWFFFSSATVRDMMRFYRGFYPTFDMDRYERFKEVFAIPEKSVIRRLSKGMQKQVAFWVTMCCRPKFLVLDEPVDGLDPVMRRQVWSLMMSDVAEYGTTVLVSSHNLREQGKGAAGAEPQRPPGEYRQAPGGLALGEGAGTAGRAAGAPHLPCGKGVYLHCPGQCR